jgi:hypothetical protein
MFERSSRGWVGIGGHEKNQRKGQTAVGDQDSAERLDWSSASPEGRSGIGHMENCCTQALALCQTDFAEES